MTRGRSTGGLAIAVLLLLIGAGQSMGQEQAAEAPDAAAMEKMWTDFAKLAPQHEQFKRLVGRWKTETRTYEGEGEGELSRGSATFRLLLGGRYLQQRFRSSFGGQTYEGLGIAGYDKAKKKYVGVWMDTMSTGFMLTEGEYDEATQTMTEVGEAETPTGKMKTKMISKEVNDNQFVFTMYMVQPDGKEAKAMEITYTREPARDRGEQ